MNLRPCTDGNCLFRDPASGGMVTNGCCHCLDDVRRTNGIHAEVLLRMLMAAYWDERASRKPVETTEEQLGLVLDDILTE